MNYGLIILPLIFVYIIWRTVAMFRKKRPEIAIFFLFMAAIVAYELALRVMAFSGHGGGA